MSDVDRCDAVCRDFNAARYYGHLGMVASSAAPGRSTVRLPFDEKLTQLYGGIHGGALTSLADAAISIAVATTVSETEAVATVELSIQFIAPAGPNDVVAEGTLTRRGRRLAFGSCVLTAGDREVARAQGIWHVGSRATIDKSRAR